jgi:type IV secretory pathway TrbL component
MIFPWTVTTVSEPIPIKCSCEGGVAIAGSGAALAMGAALDGGGAWVTAPGDAVEGAELVAEHADNSRIDRKVVSIAGSQRRELFVDSQMLDLVKLDILLAVIRKFSRLL